MRIRHILVVACALPLIVGAAPASAAGTEKIPVSGAIVGYTSYDPTIGAVGGVYDFTVKIDSWAGAVWAGSPYLQGTEPQHAVVSAHYSCDTSWNCTVRGGSLSGSGTITLDGFDGGWTETVHARVMGLAADGQSILFEGSGIGHGWGELDGWVLTYTWDNYAGYIAATGWVMSPGS